MSTMGEKPEEMRLWVRTELLCIHFDAWKVALDTWPIPFVDFKAILLDKVLEHVRESRCIFVQEDLQNVRNDPKEIAHVLDKNCRFFVQRGASKAEEIKDLDVLDYDDDVYVSLCDWSGYDTTEITSEESEDENNGALEQSLVEEWDTEDVVFWLETNGLHAFTQGFKDQKIDGMCLKEGLSDEDLVCCNVHTVGEKRLLQRKLTELVGHSKPKVPKLTKRALSTKALSPQQKEELLRRKRQVHRKTVKMFPGNKIPIIRGNVVAKRQFEDLVQSCKDLLKPDIGYDEDELRRHIRAIMDERRRMVREGYSYADEGETSSTDDSDVKAREKNICGEEGSDGDHSFEASQSKTNARHGKGKRSSSGENACEQYIRGEEGSDGDHSFEASQNKTNGSQGGKGKKRSSSDEKSAEENICDEEGSDEDELQLPGGATTVPLSTAETILLAFFKKGYTKEIKKEEHLNPLCREMKIKNFKAKDKAELIIILAKELLLKKTSSVEKRC